MATESDQKKWDQLLDAFRDFGGTANNVIQRPGPFGLGLFPINPDQPSELRVPEHLLIPVKRVSLQDGAVVLKDESGFPKGYADWFQRFQADFSWGAEAQRTIENFENSLESLPTPFLKQLSLLGLHSRESHIPQTSNPQYAFDRFIKTRQIQHSKRLVLMPIIELINHSPGGTTWNMSGDGIAVAGTFKGEIMVRYSCSDPLHRLLQYGFNCQEPNGFSVNLQFKHRNLQITVKGGINHQSMKPVKVASQHNQLIINQPLLGSFTSPKIPRALFRASLKDFKVEADELFDQIQHLNRMAVIKIIRDLSSTKSSISNQLRIACMDQLAALSCHVGSQN